MNPEFLTLTNGLKIALVPCEAESVAFGLFIASGSRHEGPQEGGISHFIEHMLFKGTPTRRAIDITRAIEGRGGNFNACTAEEATCYYAHLPDEYLAEAIDILTDMYLNASLPEDEFVRERQVVLEEIKMYGDDPDTVVLENLQRALFPRHPLGNPVAGSAATLAPMTTKTLKDYIATHYTPERTAAVIAGKFDRDKAIKLVESRLGSISPSSSRSSSTSRSRLLPPIATIETTKEVQQAQLAIGYRTFGGLDTRRYAATVVEAILGRGMSSRLFQEVREKRGLSYDISSRLQFFREAGMFVIAAGLDGANLELARKTIDREIERIRTKRISAAELKRTKEFMLGNFRLAHERITSKLFFYGSALLSYGRLVPLAEDIAAVRAVTADDILAVANDIFRPELSSVSLILPR